MENGKNIFLKLLILVIIIVLPVVVLLAYSKEHTYIEQDQSLSKEFAKYFTHDYTILYVGYTGCKTVCSPRLKEISTMQRVLADRGNSNLQYMFLDLRTLDMDISEHFLKSFEGNFGLLFLEKEDKNSLLRELGFYFAKSLYDSNEFEHSSHLYLIEKKDKNIKLAATIMQFPFINEVTLNYLDKRVNYGKK